MIFAKVDVKLRDHAKALRAGEAMSTWLWALLYTREQELDGLIPSEVLRLAWPGEQAATRHAATLVAVGLWEVCDEGWRICGYAAKNETSAVIDEKRRTDRERKRKSLPPPSSSTPESAGGFRRESETIPVGIRAESERIPPAPVVGFPGSRSLSGSGSGSREDLPPLSPREGVVHLRRDEPLTADARGVWETVTMNRPIKDSVAGVWLGFCGHFAGKEYPSREALLGAWQKWVAGQARMNETQRGRANADRRDEPPPPPTPEQSKRFAESLAAKVRELHTKAGAK